MPSLTHMASSFYYRVVVVRGIRYYVKYLAAWLILVTYAGLAYLMRDTAPVWPVTYYTPMWLLAFFFPATASFYLMYNLGMRLDEIQDAVQRRELHRVYFPNASADEAEQLFARFLMRRFREYYNPWEFASYSILAGAVGFLSLFLLGRQLALPTAELPPIVTAQIADWILLVSAGFLGSAAGTLVMIYRKYRAFDVYPSTYLHAAIALVLGTLAAGFLATTFDYPQIRFIAFSIGFLTALNVNYLADLLIQRSKIAGMPVQEQLCSDLHEIVQNSDAIKSLQDLSLCSVSELVKSEPMVLYLNMPQPIGVINGWIDEGLLHYYFGTHLDTLRSLNVQRFTQLVHMLTERFDPAGVVWRKAPIVTGDSAADGRLAAAVGSIIDARLHHSLLAIIWEKYRKEYFLPSFGVLAAPPPESSDAHPTVPPPVRNGSGLETPSATLALQTS